METRLPHPGHDDETPAPGDLELLRSFLTLHDHVAGRSESLPPSSDAMAWWFGTKAALGPDETFSPDELALALEVHRALLARIDADGRPDADADAYARLSEAVEATGLRPRFDGSEPRLDTEAAGALGVLGSVLGTAFLAQLDGSWDRFRVCADPTCRSVFFDRSKNHSGKWCSMQTCGNRSKVRAFRERHAAT